MSDFKMLQVLLPSHIHKALRQQCADTDSTLKDLVQDLIVHHLQDPRFAIGDPKLNSLGQPNSK